MTSNKTQQTVLSHKTNLECLCFDSTYNKKKTFQYFRKILRAVSEKNLQQSLECSLYHETVSLDMI